MFHKTVKHLIFIKTFSLDKDKTKVVLQSYFLNHQQRTENV